MPSAITISRLRPSEPTTAIARLAEMEPGEPDPDIRKIIGFALQHDRS